MTKQEAKKEFRNFIDNIYGLRQTSLSCLYKKPSAKKQRAYEKICDFTLDIADDYNIDTTAVYPISGNTFTFNTLFGIMPKRSYDIKLVVKDTPNNRYIFDCNGNIYKSFELADAIIEVVL